MALTIPSPEAEQLARAVATEAGETPTQAIVRSLEERLARLRGKKTDTKIVEVVMEISRRCSALPDLDARTPEEILGYDDCGLPR